MDESNWSISVRITDAPIKATSKPSELFTSSKYQSNDLIVESTNISLKITCKGHIKSIRPTMGNDDDLNNKSHKISGDINQERLDKSYATLDRSDTKGNRDDDLFVSNVDLTLNRVLVIVDHIRRRYRGISIVNITHPYTNPFSLAKLPTLSSSMRSIQKRLSASDKDDFIGESPQSSHSSMTLQHRVETFIGSILRHPYAKFDKEFLDVITPGLANQLQLGENKNDDWNAMIEKHLIYKTSISELGKTIDNVIEQVSAMEKSLKKFLHQLSHYNRALQLFSKAQSSLTTLLSDWSELERNVDAFVISEHIEREDDKKVNVPRILDESSRLSFTHTNLIHTKRLRIRALQDFIQEEMLRMEGMKVSLHGAKEVISEYIQNEQRAKLELALTKDNNLKRKRQALVAKLVNTVSSSSKSLAASFIDSDTIDTGFDEGEDFSHHAQYYLTGLIKIEYPIFKENREVSIKKIMTDFAKIQADFAASLVQNYTESAQASKALDGFRLSRSQLMPLSQVMQYRSSNLTNEGMVNPDNDDSEYMDRVEKGIYVHKHDSDDDGNDSGNDRDLVVHAGKVYEDSTSKNKRIEENQNVSDIISDEEESATSRNDIQQSESENEKYLLVIYDFIAENEGEVTAKENQILRGIHQENEEWWFVENTTTKETGYIQASYVEEYHNENANLSLSNLSGIGNDKDQKLVQRPLDIENEESKDVFGVNPTIQSEVHVLKNE